MGDTAGVKTHPDDPHAVSAAAEHTARVTAALRASVVPLIEALAGDPPRPSRLMRVAGLDKSIASRFAQAARAGSDAEFLHILPSPAGLRMLAERAASASTARPLDLALLGRVEAAIDDFQSLIDTLPGGRQALDAQIGEQSNTVRQKREHMARQAAFKAQSFLFGHYCETLTTALFVLPSATLGKIDLLEVHRRIGLRRVSPSAAVPVLSVRASAGPVPDDDAAMASIEGDATAHEPADFLIAEASSTPLPRLHVEREGQQATFILPGDASATPARLTTAFRILRADSLQQHEAYNVLRSYLLHLPCETLVRDIYIAHGLWPDAYPQVGFYLPSPLGLSSPPIVPGRPHYSELQLSARVEQLPPGRRAFELAGVPDQREAIEAVLVRAGADPERFRGWRCEMPYPLPLVEMRIAFQFAAAA